MSAQTKLLSQREVRELYNISKWQIRMARETGYIGTIKGPKFIKLGKRHMITRHEMDVYVARHREFSRLFLNSARMTTVIDSRYAGVSYRTNWDAWLIARMEPYLSVMPPECYTFHGLGGKREQKFWHLEDVQMFNRFIEGSMSGRLNRDTHPNYDSKEHVWRPDYPSPADFPERYTDETRSRLLGE